ncbi:OTU-domain-containing protein [Mucor ambiguus]|uniref:Ubiquitin thioesterase OTU n=1 Tax=Mucor ambiguus TaxID=91626 RepID=A0A0C9MDC6_9FUNG|nr:OTU-domain-containing protein [Mucor ambiguus]
MRLRIRHAEGMATLSDVKQEDTVSMLKDAIRNAISLDATRDIQISGGYPPKPFNDMKMDLKNAGLRDGDTLNIKLVDTPTPQQQQPSSTTNDSTPSGTLKALKEGSVQTVNGVLQLRLIIPCFNVGYVLRRDTTISLELRQDKYMQWIQKPNSWGGAIELAIFSAYFGVEIDSIDVQTGRIDKFGEGSFNERVLIVYSGIHYDALALTPTIDSPPDFDQTRFSVGENSILDAAKQLVDGLRKSHKFTDIANFTLKCEQCSTGLKGEKGKVDLDQTVDIFN